MNSEDKLIERLKNHDYHPGENDLQVITRWSFEREEAASELSRRAIRIEELEKALDPFARLELSTEHSASTDMAWSEADLLRFRADAIERRDREIGAARQALSDHPDKASTPMGGQHSRPMTDAEFDEAEAALACDHPDKEGGK